MVQMERASVFDLLLWDGIAAYLVFELIFFFSYFFICLVHFLFLLSGEIMTTRDYFATALIMIGCVLSVAFASHKDTTYCPEIIWNQFNQLGVILYFITIAILVLSLLLFSRWAERVENDLGYVLV